MTADASMEAMHALAEQGRFAQARTLLMRRLSKGRFDLDAAMLMSVVATSMGEPAVGEYWAARCVQAAPDEPNAHANYVSALTAQSKHAEAIAMAERAAARLPDSSIVAALLPIALHRADRRWEAFEALERGIARFPEEVRLYRHAVSTCLAVGRSDRGLELARRCLELQPNEHRVASDLVRAYAYAQEDSVGVDAALRAYQRAMVSTLGPASTAWGVTPDPDRPIRVGVLSGDLRDHSVMFWGMPWIERFDRSSCRVTCYSTGAGEDGVTARIKSLVQNWRRITSTDPRALYDTIAGDSVDVLLELSGHTPGEMLPTVHLKPAPVVIHWIAWPGSIGLASVDHRITDRLVDPPGSPWLGVEKPLYIDPCYVPFRPNARAPLPAPCPFETAGHITFGSISSMMKLGPATLELWRRVLEAVPSSRLYYKSFWLSDPLLMEKTAERMVRAGIPRARLTLDGASPGAAETMACYAHFDISLDTYPYHGMTTTCESTWMGVPLVSLAGKTTASRVNCSFLPALGVGELLAQTPDEYVRIASALAADPDRLRRWRSHGPEGLRAKMAASPLRDEEGFARSLDAAIRSCWRAYCARARG